MQSIILGASGVVFHVASLVFAITAGSEHERKKSTTTSLSIALFTAVVGILCIWGAGR